MGRMSWAIKVGPESVWSDARLGAGSEPMSDTAAVSVAVLTFYVV